MGDYASKIEFEREMFVYRTVTLTRVRLAHISVLIHAGFTKKRALLLNLLTASSAVVGVILALIIGQSVEEGSRWLLAFTAGNFFYIALADMIQTLVLYVDFFCSHVMSIGFCSTLCERHTRHLFSCFLCSWYASC